MSTDTEFLSTLQAMASYPPPRTPVVPPAHYVSPREERVVPSKLAHHSWLGWGPPNQADVMLAPATKANSSLLPTQALQISTVPSPNWGRRSSDVKGYIGPSPGSDFEEYTQALVASPSTVLAPSSMLGNERLSPRSRLSARTPLSPRLRHGLPPVHHGDVKGRILAHERVKTHHATHGLLRERQHKTPGFLQLHPMVSPTRRPWRVAGLPMTTAPRIDAPPTKPPVKDSIFNDD